MAGASGAKRSAKTSAPATPRLVVASLQPMSIASPVLPGIDRSTIPDDLELEATAVGGGHGHGLTDRHAEAIGEGDREDRGAAGIERGERRGPVARHEPEAAVGRHVGADDGRRVGPRSPPTATSNVAIGLIRAIPGTAALS